MNGIARPIQTESENTQPKWFNSPVRVHEGTLSEVRQFIPDFERRSFALTQPENDRSRINERLDTIVRRPFGDDPSCVPIGVVSRGYTLVSHAAIFDAVTQALRAVEIPAGNVQTELAITEYGERMALSLYLPEKFKFDPGDGHPMALRLECLNSVDGSTRFRALISWLRLVCSNGLVVGVTRSAMRRRHVGEFQLEDVGEVLASGLRDAESEKQNFIKWKAKEIAPNRLASWIEKELREKWGFKAATRTHHIACCGWDVEILGQYKGETPTTVAVRQTKPVPGTWPPCRNLFDVSQILAWLAKERRDVSEQLAWREQIPGLLESLN